MSYKFQRIRDPLHNLVEFPADQFHDTIWRVIQTREFQRLRRIKQLGFSELVYPGANHSRFVHSIGVFHTARRLMQIIREHQEVKDWQDTRAKAALAASLVHDLGHGPYSHAFENVGKRLSLPMAKHERITDLLVRSGEVGTVLNGFMNGFASEVADVIAKAGPTNIYSAVVSSQFDADRLDYMRRDRLMTGTHHGAIDFEWLLSNLDVGTVPYGSDATKAGEIETFVLGPKALHAAETYLLGLFQLYATVYFHKATRGAEKIFTELLARLFELVLHGSVDKTGLNDRHPLIRFAKSPDDLRSALALDDSAVGGALVMMTEAEDGLISDFAGRLRDRRLFKCIDVREKIKEKWGSRGTGKTKGTRASKREEQRSLPKRESVSSDKNQGERSALDRACKEIEHELKAWNEKNTKDIPRLLIDTTERSIYNTFEESKGPLEQIMIKPGMGNVKPVDVASVSQVIEAIAPFKLFRVYLVGGDEKANNLVNRVIEKEAKGCQP
jgi:uncharacterized protein